MAYNIIRKDISSGLSGTQISSMGAGNYLILRYASPGANVKVRLGSNTAPAIDMIQDDSIESSLVGSVYIEADSVPGGYIVFAQANTSKDFKITPAPAIKNIEVDNFFIPTSDQQITVTAGGTTTLDTSNIYAIRFLSDDDVGVSLNASGIYYPMLEDEIFCRDVSSLVFKNDGASDINIVIWSM